MFKRFLWIVCCVSVLALWSKGVVAEESMVIRGSHALFWTLKPHLGAIKKATGVNVDFSGAGGCGDAAKSVAAGKTGAVCCRFDNAELAALGGGVLHSLALEPLMIIVNKKNPVVQLTAQQVEALLTGQVTNWKAVGGADQEVAVIFRPHCRFRPGHWKVILPFDQWRNKRIKVNSTVKMITTVAAIPGAIGHLGSVLLDPGKMKVLSIDGVSPLETDPFARNYPYYRPLSILTQGEATRSEQKVVDFLRSEAGKKILSAKHLVPNLTFAPSLVGRK